VRELVAQATASGARRQTPRVRSFSALSRVDHARRGISSRPRPAARAFRAAMGLEGSHQRTCGRLGLGLALRSISVSLADTRPRHPEEDLYARGGRHSRQAGDATAVGGEVAHVRTLRGNLPRRGRRQSHGCATCTARARAGGLMHGFFMRRGGVDDAGRSADAMNGNGGRMIPPSRRSTVQSQQRARPIGEIAHALQRDRGSAPNYVALKDDREIRRLRVPGIYDVALL